MDCDDRFRISCQLDRIADTLDGSELGSFLATLLATLLGAAVAGLISLWLYRHELRTRRQSQIDVAVSELIREVQRYSQEYRRFLEALRAWQRSESDRLSALTPAQKWTGSVGAPAAPGPEHPPREGIDTAVEMLIVLTAGDDRRVAERARQVLYELNFLEDAEKQRVEFAAIRRVLVAWRARKRDANETIASLDIINERRRIIEGGGVEELPDAPEPMLREGAPATTI